MLMALRLEVDGNGDTGVDVMATSVDANTLVETMSSAMSMISMSFWSPRLLSLGSCGTARM